MVIVRRWVGRVRESDRTAYIRYVTSTGAADYARSPGHLRNEIHARTLDDGSCEVVTLSWWRSLAAIEAFAGDDPTLARYYPDDDLYLLSRPERVEHFEVVHETSAS